MTIVLLIARLVLALVFLVAGISKLADRPGSRQALIDFGVPPRLATPGGLLLPLAELAVALALLPSVSVWWGALGALTLLLLFVAGIAFNLARGRRPDCHCFGQLYSKPIGWPTLLRNGVLAALAGVVVGFGSPHPGLSATAWFGFLTVAQRIELIAGLVVVALLVGIGWLIFQILRQQGRLLLRIEALEERLAAERKAGAPAPAETRVAPPPAGLPVGSVAPAFALPGLSGEAITLDLLLARRKPALLLFSDPGCGPCNALLPEVGRWQRDYAGKLTVTLISRGSVEANRAKAGEHGVSGVLLQQDREVATAYQAYGTPSAALVRPDGASGSPLAQGAEAIRALVAGAVGLPVLQGIPSSASHNGNGHGNGALPLVKPSSEVPVTKIGTPAPAFSLPDLSGKAVALADLRGRRTLLLFWRPSCGFCQRMLGDLKAWEAHPPKGAPRLLVVSTGSVEENAAMGLRSTVVLDEQMRVGSTFGANGTPMAVLVDEDSKIASELAAGVPAVLELAGAKTVPSANIASSSPAELSRVN